jgi:hypothetical protein
MNPRGNDVRLELDASEHQIVVYQDKLLGWILFAVSFFPFFLLLVAPWPIWLVIGAFWLIPFLFGINLAFKERRKRWDKDLQIFVSEARWPGKRFKPLKKKPIFDFADVQIMANSRVYKSEKKLSSAGVLVRVRHKRDSQYFYTGDNSIVLGLFPTTGAAKEAEFLAAKVSQECGIPVRNSLRNQSGQLE